MTEQPPNYPPPPPGGYGYQPPPPPGGYGYPPPPAGFTRIAAFRGGVAGNADACYSRYTG